MLQYTIWHLALFYIEAKLFYKSDMKKREGGAQRDHFQWYYNYMILSSVTQLISPTQPKRTHTHTVHTRTPFHNSNSPAGCQFIILVNIWLLQN